MLAYPVGEDTAAYAALGTDLVREGVERMARVRGCRRDCMVAKAQNELSRARCANSRRE